MTVLKKIKFYSGLMVQNAVQQVKWRVRLAIAPRLDVNYGRVYYERYYNQPDEPGWESLSPSQRKSIARGYAIWHDMLYAGK